MAVVACTKPLPRTARAMASITGTGVAGSGGAHRARGRCQVGVGPVLSPVFRAAAANSPSSSNAALHPTLMIGWQSCTDAVWRSNTWPSPGFSVPPLRHSSCHSDVQRRSGPQCRAPCIGHPDRAGTNYYPGAALAPEGRQPSGWCLSRSTCSKRASGLPQRRCSSGSLVINVSQSCLSRGPTWCAAAP